MISLVELNKIIVSKIREILKGTPFQDVPLISSDVSEGFDRPSLKVDFDNVTLENLNANMLGRSLTVRVYFFASDVKKYKLENLKMLDFIECGLVNGIMTEYGYIDILDLNSNVIDTILEINFDIALDCINPRLIAEDQDAELMEDLQINGGF